MYHEAPWAWNRPFRRHTVRVWGWQPTDRLVLPFIVRAAEERQLDTRDILFPNCSAVFHTGLLEKLSSWSWNLGDTRQLPMTCTGWELLKCTPLCLLGVVKSNSGSNLWAFCSQGHRKEFFFKSKQTISLFWKMQMRNLLYHSIWMGVASRGKQRKPEMGNNLPELWTWRHVALGHRSYSQTQLLWQAQQSPFLASFLTSSSGDIRTAVLRQHIMLMFVFSPST